MITKVTYKAELKLHVHTHTHTHTKENKAYGCFKQKCGYLVAVKNRTRKYH